MGDGASLPNSNRTRGRVLSAAQPLGGQGETIIHMLEEMERECKAKIIALQEKLKEKDAIIATLTQINKDLLKATRTTEDLGLQGHS